MAFFRNIHGTALDLRFGALLSMCTLCTYSIDTLIQTLKATPLLPSLGT